VVTIGFSSSFFGAANPLAARLQESPPQTAAGAWSCAERLKKQDANATIGSLSILSVGSILLTK